MNKTDLNLTIHPLLRTALPCLVATMTVQAQLNAIPIYNPDNGHYYESIAMPVSTYISWTAANALSDGSSYLGLNGHLATITSASEQAFLGSVLSAASLSSYWLGGFQPAGSSEPGGGWTWVTGESWAYSNWAPGEPNNAGRAEQYLQFFGGFAQGQWNDQSLDNFVGGYVIEYEAPPAGVPDGGSTLSLLGLALGGIGVVSGSRFRALSA